MAVQPCDTAKSLLHEYYMNYGCRQSRDLLCPPVPQAVQPVSLGLCLCAGLVAEPVLTALELAGAAHGCAAQGGAVLRAALGAVLGAAPAVPWPAWGSNPPTSAARDAADLAGFTAPCRQIGVSLDSQWTSCLLIGKGESWQRERLVHWVLHDSCMLFEPMRVGLLLVLLCADQVIVPGFLF